MTVSKLTIKKSSVRILLALIFLLAYIFTPYWMLPSSQMIRVIILLLSLAAGGIWVHVSSSRILIEWDLRKLIQFGLFLVLLLIVNFKSLISVLPWRGDEDYHIFLTLNLVKRLPGIAGVLIPIVVIIMIITALMKPKLGMIIGTILSFTIIIYHLLSNPLHGIDLLRYPFINYWFYAIPPLAASLVTTPYREFLFRIVPFLSSVAIAWMAYDKLQNKNKIISYLWGFAFGTVPLLFYYTSILYLELPALALMLFVCLNIKDLLNADYENIKQIPAWYALILIGFIKETTIIFLLCFLAARYLFSFQNYLRETRPNKSLTSYLTKELSIAISVLGPFVAYLIFRTTLTNTRGFSPQISNLWDISLYGVLVKSFIEQFGIFLIFFFVGIAILIKQNSYKETVFLLSMFIGIPIFHILDNSGFTGYSRFNLFILAPIFSGSVIMIKSLSNWNKYVYSILAVATISVNLFLSPINIDGTKKPLWGNYLVDTSEHYYPYKKALSWLKETNHENKMIFSGMYYRYKFQFYFNNLGWWPNHKIITIDKNINQNEAILQVLADANMEGINIVLYQLTNEDIPIQQDLGGFFVKKILRNQAHSLVVFMKTE